jgi:hypothetical protein
MDILFWSKVLIVFTLADILPFLILVLLYRFKVIPKNVLSLGALVLIFIDDKIQDYLNFGYEVNNVANYLATILFLIFIVLAIKYRWFTNDDNPKDNETK